MPKSLDLVEIYPHKRGKLAGKFDWRRTDAYNHKIVATSHNQGYENRSECERMAKKINGTLARYVCSG